jgi:hypothetical protein
MDLSSTQLTEQMCWLIAKGLSRAPGIQVLHMCGNPGLTPEFKTQIQLRIRCRRQEVPRRIVCDTTHRESQAGESDLKQSRLRESMEIRELKKKPVLDGKMAEHSVKPEGRFVLSRHLGY